MENKKINTSNITAHVLRLKPGQDLYQEIINYINTNNIEAAFIMTCVGSLKKANLRTATGANFIQLSECHEIVSLVGCISKNRKHLHISLGDKDGAMKGGHLMPEGNIVYTTAEIVIGELPGLFFDEEHCEMSTWPELKISKK